MIIKAFAVYDTKALCYGQPFFSPTSGAAVRMFSDLANDKQSSVNKHPTDYILMEIGIYDDQNGQLSSEPQPKNLGLASDYLERPKMGNVMDDVLKSIPHPSSSPSRGETQVEVLK